MGMEVFSLSESVQYGYNPGAYSMLMLHPLFQGIGRYPHLHVKQSIFISSDEMDELVRNREYYMSMWYVEHIFLNFLGPANGIIPAAGGTESVFTAVINLGGVPTFGTRVDVYSQSCCPAGPDCINCLILPSLNKYLWAEFVNIPP